MEISFSNSFKRAFKKKIDKTVSEEVFWRAIELFVKDPFDPQLKRTNFQVN